MLLALLCAPPVHAASQAEPAQDVRMSIFMTGNDLYARCSTDINDPQGVGNYGFCRGYILGAADFYGTYAAEMGASSCLSETVTTQQLIDVVVKYLRDHPEKRHAPASYAVIAAVPSLMIRCPG